LEGVDLGEKIKSWNRRGRKIQVLSGRHRTQSHSFHGALAEDGNGTQSDSWVAETFIPVRLHWICVKGCCRE
jgi:hypothetical protein